METKSDIFNKLKTIIGNKEVLTYGNAIKAMDLIEKQVQKKQNNNAVIPKDAHSLEVFAIKESTKDSLTGKEAYIGYKLGNGDFHFISVPFTEPLKQAEPIKNKKQNSYYKYIVMSRILDKNWIKRNKQNPELTLSGIDEQMIFDCMDEYCQKQNELIRIKDEEIGGYIKIIEKMKKGINKLLSSVEIK